MKILGINGGNGVILYPMRKHLIGNVEARSNFKTPDDIQWRLNFGDTRLETNAGNCTNFDFPDVIVGAPNCGHSSMLAYSRAKVTSDPLKDDSFELYMVSLVYFKPKVFMMENLPKSLEMVSEDVWQRTLPDYELIFHNLPCTAWGNSQKTRKRLVLIGLKKEHFGENLSKAQYHFSKIYKVNKLKTCKELSKGLKKEDFEFGHVREDISDLITIYAGKKLTLRKIQKFWLKNPNLKRWPVDDRKFTTAPGVYRNLDNDNPAVARKANRQFNQKGLQLTPRELARIQGVPDKFKIYMDPDRKTFSINKGRTTVTKTPPYEIARWFYKQLKKVEPWI